MTHPPGLFTGMRTCVLVIKMSSVARAPSSRGSWLGVFRPDGVGRKDVLVKVHPPFEPILPSQLNRPVIGDVSLRDDSALASVDDHRLVVGGGEVVRDDNALGHIVGIVIHCLDQQHNQQAK